MSNWRKCRSLQGQINSLSKISIGFILKQIMLQEKFVPYIKQCTSNQYVMIKSEVWENKNICYEKKQWISWLMTNNYSLNTKKLCPCTGKFSYDCGVPLLANLVTTAVIMCTVLWTRMPVKIPLKMKITHKSLKSSSRANKLIDLIDKTV